ncbi:MAG: hypothetical protein OHK0053_20790 [Microscillaceae bacterium]
MQTIETAYQQKELEQVWQGLDSLLAQYPDYAPAYARRGLLHYEFAQYAEALQDYGQAIVLQPGAAPYFYQRAIVHYQLNQTQDFEKDLRQTLTLEPSYAVAQTALGAWQYEQRQYRKALQTQTQVIAQHPDFLTAYYNRALVQWALRKPERALSDLNFVLTRDTVNTDALSLRLLVWEARQDYPALLQDAQKLIDLKMHQGEAYFYRGLAHWHLGKKSEACQDWQQSSALGYAEVQSWQRQYCP